MVDFRYHLVSIVAVFLALATGIAIGATALNGGVVHNLNSQIRRLIGEKNDLRSQYEAVQTTSDDSDAFVKAVTPRLVAHKLQGRKVAIISLPDADKTSRDQAGKAMLAAGATVVAQVHLSEKSVDPASSQQNDTAIQAINDELTGSHHLSLSAGSSVTHLGQILGEVLVTRGKPTLAGVTFMNDVLTGLHDAGLLSVDGQPAIATMAIVVGNQPAQSSSARDALTTSLAQQLAKSGSGTLVVGPKAAAQSGGSVAAIRGDARTALVVSTADDADRPMGLPTMVMALVDLLHGGVGQYGTGVGASSVIPSPAS